MKMCRFIVFLFVLSAVFVVFASARRRRNYEHWRTKFVWRNGTSQQKERSSSKISTNASDASPKHAICWQRMTRMDKRKQKREIESEREIQIRLHQIVDLLPHLNSESTNCWLRPIREDVMKLRAEYESKIEMHREMQIFAERSPDLPSNDRLCRQRPTRKDIIKLRNEYVRKIEIHKRLQQLAELLPQMPSKNCSNDNDSDWLLLNRLKGNGIRKHRQKRYRMEKDLALRPYKNYSFTGWDRKTSSKRPARVLQKRAARVGPRFGFEDPHWRMRRRERKVKRCNKETHLLCSDRCIKLQSVCDGEVDCPNGADEADCEYMEINLEGGRRVGEGRVDLTISNVQGTICDQGWDDRAAIVTCRMMGYKNPEHAKATKGLKFGQGSGAIWMSQVSCNGSEDHIHSCITSVWGEHSCTHAQDAGVICMPRRDYTEVPTTPKSFLPNEPTCGQRFIAQWGSKILGGRTTAYGALPWQARVMRYKQGTFFHHCGGTIIGKKWIVTAAHCFDNLSAEQSWVTVGDHDSRRRDSKEHRFRVDKIFFPSQYKPMKEIEPSFDFQDILSFFARKTSVPYETFTHDIALLKLKPTDGHYINFNSHVQPACLPTSATPYQPGLRCEVSGWGFSGHNPTRLPEALQYAIVPIMSTSDCEQSYQYPFKQELPKEMFCAGFARGAVDTCQGDSGGPLVCSIHGSHTLMGVTSWGFECGASHHAGVYTKVGVVVDWINEVLSDNK